jgi:hypothetical protein
VTRVVFLPDRNQATKRFLGSNLEFHSSILKLHLLSIDPNAKVKPGGIPTCQRISRQSSSQFSIRLPSIVAIPSCVAMMPWLTTTAHILLRGSNRLGGCFFNIVPYGGSCCVVAPIAPLLGASQGGLTAAQCLFAHLAKALFFHVLKWETIVDLFRHLATAKTCLFN